MPFYVSTTLPDAGPDKGSPLAQGNILSPSYTAQGVYDRHEVCGICGAVFATLGGRKSHEADHAEGQERCKPVTRYYVTRAHLEAFRAQSKREISRR